jgi:hypothetical protein
MISDPSNDRFTIAWAWHAERRPYGSVHPSAIGRARCGWALHRALGSVLYRSDFGVVDVEAKKAESLTEIEIDG